MTFFIKVIFSISFFFTKEKLLSTMVSTTFDDHIMAVNFSWTLLQLPEYNFNNQNRVKILIQANLFN